MISHRRSINVEIPAATQAFKFEQETSGLCCSDGKVKLSNYEKLPEPLKSLMTGDHPKFTEFVRLLRKNNSTFQMTSFGTSVPVHQF